MAWACGIHITKRMYHHINFKIVQTRDHRIGSIVGRGGDNPVGQGRQRLGSVLSVVGLVGAIFDASIHWRAIRKSIHTPNYKQNQKQFCHHFVSIPIK